MGDSAIDLDELEALLAKATPLPYTVGQRPDGPFDPGRHFIKSGEHGTVCFMSFPDIGDDDDNARALVGAINVLPSLIARIRKLEEVNAALKSRINQSFVWDTKSKPEGFDPRAIPGLPSAASARSSDGGEHG